MTLVITTLRKNPEYLLQAAMLWDSVESRLWEPEPGYILTKLQPCTDPDASRTALIVLSGLAVIGLAVLQPTAEVSEDIGPWLSYLVVHPTFRCLGIARQLIAEICRQSHSKSVYLFTANATLPNYYKSLGWESFQQTIFRGLPALIMKYTLKDG